MSDKKLPDIEVEAKLLVKAFLGRRRFLEQDMGLDTDEAQRRVSALTQEVEVELYELRDRIGGGFLEGY